MPSLVTLPAVTAASVQPCLQLTVQKKAQRLREMATPGLALNSATAQAEEQPEMLHE